MQIQRSSITGTPEPGVPWAPQIFDRSVNPISKEPMPTMEGQMLHTNYYSHPQIFSPSGNP